MTSPVTAASYAIGSVHPLSRTGNTFLLGGVLWVAHYCCRVALGLTGDWLPAAAPHGPLQAADAACFAAAVWALCTGIISLADFLVRWSSPQALSRSEGLARAAMGLASLACAAALLGLIRFFSMGQEPGLLGGGAIAGSCLAAAALGIAVRRGQSLPSRPGKALVLLGAAMLPLLGVSALLSLALPASLIGALPYALAGAGYMWLGRTLGKL